MRQATETELEHQFITTWYQITKSSTNPKWVYRDDDLTRPRRFFDVEQAQAAARETGGQVYLMRETLTVERRLVE